MVQTTTVLSLNHQGNFSCLANKCPDTCCKHWNIDLDQESLQRLRDIKEPILQERISDCVIDVNSENETIKGLILLKEDRHCSLLGDDGLCAIHTHAGENSLPRACRLFPYEINNVDGITEISLQVSCPETSRIILQNASLPEMQLSEEQKQFHHDFPMRVLHFENEDKRNHFWFIRTEIFKILQQQKVSLWSRLYAINYWILTQANRQEIAPFCDSLLTHPEAAKQPVSFKRSFHNRVTQSPKFKPMLEEVRRKYTTNIENRIATQSNSPLDKLENYIFNLIFQTLFPCEPNSPTDVQCAFLIGHMSALFSYAEHATDISDLVDMTYRFNRYFSHSIEGRKMLLELGKEIFYYYRFPVAASTQGVLSN